MSFWSLTALLCLSNGPAYAEWLEVEEDHGLRTVYVDSGSIHREGNLVQLWQLIDFRWMQGNQGFGPFSFGPDRFLSTKTYKQFDCGGKRVRLLEFIKFSLPMGTGTAAHGYVDEDNWLPVEAKSINQALWEVACAGLKS